MLLYLVESLILTLLFGFLALMTTQTDETASLKSLHWENYSACENSCVMSSVALEELNPDDVIRVFLAQVWRLQLFNGKPEKLELWHLKDLTLMKQGGFDEKMLVSLWEV